MSTNMDKECILFSAPPGGDNNPWLFFTDLYYYASKSEAGLSMEDMPPQTCIGEFPFPIHACWNAGAGNKGGQKIDRENLFLSTTPRIFDPIIAERDDCVFLDPSVDLKAVCKNYEHLHTLNQAGYGILFFPNTFRKLVNIPYTENNILRCNAIFADFDFSDPKFKDTTPEEKEAMIQKVKEIIYPTAVVRTSPYKYHLYWFLDQQGATVSEFKEITKRMLHVLKHYGADESIKDAGRRMRMPGFYHNKDLNNLHMVEIVEYTQVADVDNSKEYKDVHLPIENLRPLRYSVKTFYDVFPKIPEKRISIPAYWDGSQTSSENYMRSTMYCVFSDLLGVKQGERNNKLFSKACYLFQRVKESNFDYFEVINTLTNAGGGMGLPSDEVKRTIQSAQKRIFGSK